MQLTRPVTCPRSHAPQRTHVILLEIMAEETQASSMTLLDEFDRLRRLGPGGTKLLSDRAVSQLLDLFSTRWKEGNSVRQLVAALREDGRRITDLVPVAQKVDADENAPSFATSWLAGRLSDFKTVAEVRDEGRGGEQRSAGRWACASSVHSASPLITPFFRMALHSPARCDGRVPYIAQRNMA